MSDLLSECLPMVRHLVDDTDEADYEFSDSRLSSLIFVAAMYVNQDMRSGYSISLCSQTISPEPDAQFINLVSLRSACMLLKGVHTGWARNDFRVSDGPTTVDMKNITDKVKQAADSACQTYEKTKLDIQMGGTTLTGVVISTPNSESE